MHAEMKGINLKNPHEAASAVMNVGLGTPAALPTSRH
jgi:hypothetical protein